jgi:hypothetical protein
MFDWIKSWFIKGPEKEPFKMDVQDFISEALLQICNGIKDAQNKTSGRNEEIFFQPLIVPTPVNSSGPSPRDNFYSIDFDLAVTIEKKSRISSEIGLSAGGKILVVPIDINIERAKSTDETTSSISRMKFSIPVIYPSVPKPH